MTIHEAAAQFAESISVDIAKTNAKVADLHAQSVAVGQTVVATTDDLAQQIHALATKVARLEGRIPPPAPNPSPLPSPVPEPEPEPTPAPDTGFIARKPSPDALKLSPNARENDLHEALSTGRDVLLQAGSRIGLAITPQIKREGQLLGTHGDGNRPEITVRSDFGNRAMLDIVRAPTATVTGIRFAGVPNSLGVFVGEGCDGLLVEDVEIEGCTDGVKIIGDHVERGRIKVPDFHRCVIKNLVHRDKSRNVTGIYAEGTDGLFVRDCVFDEIGTDAVTNQRKAIYVQKATNSATDLSDNLFSRCAADAFQLRSGGGAYQNLILHCPIESHAYGPNSVFIGNVVMYGASGLYSRKMDHAVFLDNVFAHGIKGSDGYTQHALRLGAKTHTVTNNRVFDWSDGGGWWVAKSDKTGEATYDKSSNRVLDSLDHGIDLDALTEREANRPRGVWYGGVADAVERIQEVAG